MAKTIEEIQSLIDNQRLDSRQILNLVVDYLQENPGGDSGESGEEGGIGAFEDLTGKPSDNAALKEYVGRVNVKDFGAVGDDTTNDGVAINAAIDALLAVGGGELFFPGHTPYYGTGVRVPGQSLVGGYKSIVFCGEGTPPWRFGTAGSGVLSNKGSILRSDSTTEDVIDIQAFEGDFSAVKVLFKNFTVRTYANPQINGIHGGWAGMLNVDDVAVDTGEYSVVATEPTHTGATGIITPYLGNAADTSLRHVSISGFYRGIEVNEHTYGSDLKLTGLQIGLTFAAAQHSSTFTRLCIQNVAAPITVTGVHRFKISHLNLEHAGPPSPADEWQYTNQDVYDPSNLGIGSIEFDSATLNGSLSYLEFTKVGGINILCKPVGGIPKWTTAERPTEDLRLSIGFNTETGKFEGWTGSSWFSFSHVDEGDYDSDASAWFSRVNGAGYTMSTEEKDLYNAFILGLKEDGNYTLLNAFWLPIGGSAGSNCLMFKDANYNLTFSGGGWIHSTYKSTPNGTTSYANTHLNPAVDFGADVDFSIGIVTTDDTNTGSGQADMGATDGSNSLWISAQYDGDGITDDALARNSSNSILLQADNADAKGFYVTTKGTTTSKLYKNATQIDSDTSGGDMPDNEVYIGGIKSIDPALLSNRGFAFAFMAQTELSGAAITEINGRLKTLLDGLGLTGIIP